MVLRTLHLCSGYDGFELALRLAGVRSRTVAHVERDAYAAATLVARMEDQALDRAPVWSDLTTFDGRAWRGAVDLVTAGFPCQPFSAAGEKRGVDDERWLWPAIGRIVRDVGPRFVLLENVPQLVGLGLPHVLADLAELGFDAEWGLLSAAAVGAPHKRERLWLLAHADVRQRQPASGERPLSVLGDLGRCREAVGYASSAGGPAIARGALGDEGSPAGRTAHGADVADGAGEDVGDPTGIGRLPGHRPRPDEPEGWRTDAQGAGGGLADPCGPRPQGSRTGAGRVQRAWPPGRDDVEGWRDWIADGGPEPSLRRVADGPPAGLADALHLGGNGLVPLVAAHAFAELASRLGVGEVVSR